MQVSLFRRFDLFNELDDRELASIAAVAKTRRYAKDAFHERVVNGNEAAVNPAKQGTKAAAWYRLTVPVVPECLRPFTRHQTSQLQGIQ